MNRWFLFILLFALPGLARAQLGNLPNMTEAIVADADLFVFWDASGTAVRSVRGDSLLAFGFRAWSGGPAARGPVHRATGPHPR